MVILVATFTAVVFKFWEIYHCVTIGDVNDLLRFYTNTLGANYLSSMYIVSVLLVFRKI